MTDHPFIPLDHQRLTPEETRRRAGAFFELMDRRRSVRDFSDEPVPRELIETAIRSAEEKRTLPLVDTSNDQP